MAGTGKDSDQAKRFSSKKCHECFAYIPLEATICPSCGKKVGEIDKNGIAVKPTNWIAYAIAALAWGGFIFYLFLLGWAEPIKDFLPHLLDWVKEAGIYLWLLVTGIVDWFIESWASLLEWLVNGWKDFMSDIS